MDITTFNSLFSPSSSSSSLSSSSTIIKLNSVDSSIVNVLRLPEKKIHINRVRLKCPGNCIEVPNDWDENEDFYNEKDKFSVSKLNDSQRKIWEYVKTHRNDIILIQAGPGCGKSFVLKAIAYNLGGEVKAQKFITIIFKHDLLNTFHYCSRKYTVAKFIMTILGDMNFKAYQAFDKLVSSNLSSYNFLLTLTAMIKTAQLPKMKGSIVILDEYTIISKPLLILLLILFEHHKIGVILSGDMNQLQNIHNSVHSAKISSHDLALNFTKEAFTLTLNERCSNNHYNDIIKYIATFSCDKNLDDFAYAMVSCIFLRQTCEQATYNHLHLAGKHEDLTSLAHTLVSQTKECFTEFYAIDQSNLRGNTKQSALQLTDACIEYIESLKSSNGYLPKVGKFLPYLVLMPNARYYVNTHSEYSQGILKEIISSSTTSPSSDTKPLYVKMLMDSGRELLLRRSSNHDVMFDLHREWLLNGKPGKIYGFPIYPANFLTIHKCQGCTITENLDINLTSTNYQGLYVALSRVTNPNQISRILIVNQISHAVSSIINFPQLVKGDQLLSVDELKAGMVNYKYYYIHNTLYSQFSNKIAEFILTSNPTLKNAIRNDIIALINLYNCQYTILTPPEIKDNDDNSNGSTITLALKYRQIFVALSCLDEMDRNVWLHEFMLSDPEFRTLLPKGFKENSIPLNNLISEHESNVLMKFAGLCRSYEMEMSTIDYIKFYSKSVIRLTAKEFQENEKFIICKQNEHATLETSEFCAKVYKKLINSEPIKSSWLLQELNEMLLHFSNYTTSNPAKQPSGKTMDDFIGNSSLFTKKRKKIV